MKRLPCLQIALGFLILFLFGPRRYPLHKLRYRCQLLALKITEAMDAQRAHAETPEPFESAQKSANV